MGGIVGKLSFDRHVRISVTTLQRMLNAVGHRASAAATPARATYSGRGVALGSCDDSSTGVSHNESGTIRVVADAELTNVAPLRTLLQRRGHRFVSSTDAELIAHAYEEWGDACVEQLAGPFAFAVWDEIARRLLLARDAFGVRPLCFALLHGDGVVFASEMKALMQDPAVGRAWHPGAVDAYLAVGYVPAPLTMHPRVSKLEPGHHVVVEGRRLTTRRSWCAERRGECHHADRSVERMEACLRRSVTASADRGDACVLLSGGAASTAVAALAGRRGNAVVVGINRTGVDAVRAAAIASHLGLAVVDLTPSLDAAGLAPFLAWQMDEPLADPSALVQYAVFAAARPYARAAITGHGADAWGPRHPAAEPGALFDDELRRSMYTRHFSRRIDGVTCSVDAATVVSDGALAVADRASAAAGLRLRHPLLDRDLVEAAGLSPGVSRTMLHDIAARHLPASLRAVEDTPDADAWIGPALEHFVPGILLHDRFHARHIVSPRGLAELWDQHRTGRRDHARRLWALLMLELWFREFIDDDVVAHPLESLVAVRAA